MFPSHDVLGTSTARCTNAHTRAHAHTHTRAHTPVAKLVVHLNPDGLDVVVERLSTAMRVTDINENRHLVCLLHLNAVKGKAFAVLSAAARKTLRHCRGRSRLQKEGCCLVVATANRVCVLPFLPMQRSTMPNRPRSTTSKTAGLTRICD